MKRLKLRINLTLLESSVGFESLHKELAALSDAKKQRHLVLTILHDYSRTISSLHHCAPTTASSCQPSTFAIDEPSLALAKPSLERSQVAIKPNPLSKSEAARLALANSDLGFNQ